MSFTDTDLKHQLVLLSEIENQSDRGSAIVGSTWVEEELKTAIKSKLIDDEKVWSRLFRNSGPLGTFSSNIDLAYMLGAITKYQHSDLQLLRKIRNDFAHKLVSKEIEALNFDTPNIKDRCMSIECIKKEGVSTARQAFCRACAILYSDLYLVSWKG
ncbi:MAG: MltR family transcriptional regulator [Pseudomonadales bacterium]